MGGTGWFAFLVLSVMLAVGGVECGVTYDHKALVINGERRILISGSIHYPRSTAEMWPDLFRKAKDGGLDVIQTYVFWNMHEPSPGNYNFEGRFDLVKFVKLAQQAGLYVHLRIGPYVCAEWNFGGFPVWLKYVPGISFRTDNEPFKNAMEGFTKKVVDLMKSEGLFESQGGPIILAQVENEYKPEEMEYGLAGAQYMNWAAQMAVGMDTGVPWVMCKQDDAPDPVINTCNGFYCDNFVPNKPYKPTMWTEAWSGWYTEFGGASPHRPVEDLAFAVARFFVKGGSFVNYYMYHGGTNFGRTAGGPFIATSYDYDAPIDEYGLIRQPKWGHLKELHKAIKLCEPALVSGDPVVTSLGHFQQAYVYSAGAGNCAAFIVNYDSNSVGRVIFNGQRYKIAPWSVSILPDCRNVVFNTAKVDVQTSQMKMTPVGGFGWESIDENIASFEDNSISAVGLLEQINITRDNTDYLWYITSVEVDEDEPFIKNGGLPVLTVQSAGDALHVFINDDLAGSQYGRKENPKVRFSSGVRLNVGTNKISLLSMTVGLQNIGPHFEMANAGVLGPITLSGFKDGTRDLSSQRWSYQIGLKGETMNLHTSGDNTVEWMKGVAVPQSQPLRWYKAEFDAPAGEDPLGLDLSSMGKGQAWVNGQSIGRYWPSYLAEGVCSDGCSYEGTYRPHKCDTNCGQSSQRWYHVPRSWLQPSGNTLVLFEEIGGNPSGVSLVTRSVDSVCAHVSESHSQSINFWRLESTDQVQKLHIPKVHLQCSKGQRISAIKFASFGTPQGLCGSFQQGDCHSPNSVATIQKKCMGLRKCSLSVSEKIFGGDPCPGVRKGVAIEAVCS
jgi:hypothetical protein